MLLTTEGQTARLQLTLDLTANNVPSINKSLETLLPDPSTYDTLDLNFANTENIDSVGVTFVISLYKRVKGLQKVFKVSGASEDVQSLFRLMKLDQFFEMTN